MVSRFSCGVPREKDRWGEQAGRLRGQMLTVGWGGEEAVDEALHVHTATGPGME